MNTSYIGINKSLGVGGNGAYISKGSPEKVQYILAMMLNRTMGNKREKKSRSG